MQKKVRRRVLLIAVALLVLLVIFFPRKDWEEKAADFVEDNQAELEKIALSHLAGDDSVEEYDGVEVEGVYPGEHSIVQFRCGGRGLTPSTTYYGIYYSKDDVPTCFQNAGIALVSASEDTWTWDDGTDNGGVTRKIAPHWFYYEAWF